MACSTLLSSSVVSYALYRGMWWSLWHEADMQKPGVQICKYASFECTRWIKSVDKIKWYANDQLTAVILRLIKEN